MLKTPDYYTIERYNLTKSGRLANGKMTMDLVAKKRKLIIKWSILERSQLKKILDLIDGDDMFFTVEYLNNGEVETRTMYTGSIPTELGRMSHSNIYWKNVEISLIEQ